MAYWPEWVLARCVRIRQLIKSGYSLNEIRGMLGTDWEEEASRLKRLYRFSEMSRSLQKNAATENFVDAVLRLFPPGVLRDPRDADRITEWLHKSKTIENLLDLMAQGQNPVLVLHGDEQYVVPDFVVGQTLAKMAVTGGQFWVTSLCQPAYEAFKCVNEELDPLPKVKPVPRVVEYDEKGAQEQEVRLLGLFDYEMVGRRVCKKTRS